MLFSFEKYNASLECCQVPERLITYALPASQCVYREHENGDILSQWLLGPDYSFWIHYFFIRRAMPVFAHASESVISLVILREGTIRGVLRGFGKVLLSPGQCYLYYIPGGIHKGLLVPGFYSMVEVNFHPSHLAPVAGYYPEFEPVLRHAMKSMKKGKQHGSSHITLEACDIVDQILRSKMDAAERPLFMESRIRDLLRWYVSDQARQRNVKAGAAIRRKRIVAELLQYIDSHLDCELSVDHLAVRAGIGRSALQDMFQVEKGCSVHEVINGLRMRRAAFLLSATNNPVSAIACNVSPISFSSFCSSFKKHFGVSPGEYRKKTGGNQNK